MKRINYFLIIVIFMILCFLGTAVWVINTHTRFLGGLTPEHRDLDELEFTNHYSTQKVTALAEDNDCIMIGTDCGLFKITKSRLFTDKIVRLTEFKLDTQTYYVRGISKNRGSFYFHLQSQYENHIINYTISCAKDNKSLYKLQYDQPLFNSPVIINSNTYLISNTRLCQYQEENDLTYLNTGGYPVSSIAAYQGALFYGTFGGGLRSLTNIYTGFSNSPKIINSLLPLENKLLIGSDSGLYYYNGQIIRKITINGLIDNNISSLACYNGTVYAGTFDKGISYLKGSWKQIQFMKEHERNWVNALAVYNNQLWIASQGGIISYSRPENRIRIYERYGRHFTFIGTNQNKLIAGKNSKLYHYYSGSWTRTVISNVSILTVSSFSNSLWIGGSRGLYELKGRNTKLYSPINDTCFARWIQSLVSTKEGLFVGSYDRGIALYKDKNQWQVIDNKAWVNPNAMIYIKGVLFVGTMDTGLWIWDGQQWYKYSTQQGLAGNDVTAFAYDGQKLWIGTRSGLSVMGF